MMILMYADLVELQLRALTEADATAWGCTMVPLFLRAKVTAELKNRQLTI